MNNSPRLVSFIWGSQGWDSESGPFMIGLVVKLKHDAAKQGRGYGWRFNKRAKEDLIKILFQLSNEVGWWPMRMDAEDVMLRREVMLRFEEKHPHLQALAFSATAFGSRMARPMTLELVADSPFFKKDSA